MQESSSTSGFGPGRTPAQIRKDGNRLRDEPSLYLRQHAHNPVDWYPWGEDALARARTQDMPVFLSIGYASCHWCHVMEHEVFEDDEAAAFLNAHFVSIKVDREERPDLDHVYMAAVQAMTGRGGWPMSVFLTPQLEPFYGGTYFPRLQFLSLLRQIVEVYRDRREDLEAQAAQLAADIMARTAMQAGGGAALTLDLADAAAQGAAQYFDPVNGGFNQGQKFPTPVKWRFLLRTFRRTGDPELGAMIRRTCTAMAQGGIYDHVGGGFHRYTVDETWTVPHFEKMLYDNGQLAGLFLEAGAVFGREDFTAVGRDVLDFLLRDMRALDGGFYASYDADSGGQEGSYYVWSAAEIAAAIRENDGADDGRYDGAAGNTTDGTTGDTTDGTTGGTTGGTTDDLVLADLLGVDEPGNFEHTGKSVLTLRADLETIAARSGRSPADLVGLFARHRPTLRAVRDRRPAPGLDRKVVTSWNGLAIAALAQGYAATGEAAYRDGAVKAADFLLERHRRDDGSLWRTTSEGRPSGEGILDDYAMLADALLELFQVCDDPRLQVRYLRAARELIDFTRHEFGRAEGGYYLSRAGADAPLGRAIETFDSVEPSGMGVMVQALIKLTAITGESGYLEEARTCLQDWSGLIQRAGIEMALWCDAVTKVVEPFFDVVIAGDGKDERKDVGSGDRTGNGSDDGAAALAATFLRRLPHNAVLSRVPAAGAGEDLLALAPALAGKTAIGGRATAYVCEFGTCREPTGRPEILVEQLAHRPGPPK